MKIAIVADWLPTYGGAEHVLSALVSVWPSAPIHTTVLRTPFPGPLPTGRVRTDSFLQTIFRVLGRHQILLPFMPRAIERIDLRGYDIVLSSSHAVGKGVIPPATSVHVCYCHTPMRYAWEMEAQYLKDFRVKGFLQKRARRELKKLRRWDLSTAKRVDIFIANSSETQERIQRIYGRDSIVIPPPVEERFFVIPIVQTPTPTPYFLALGRLVPYKRFDLLIELANRLQFALKIGGTGSEFERLKAMAGPTVTFLGFVPDADLPSLYTGASALFFPQHEDAGIVPMEAQACGLPVIAYDKGGIRDVIKDGVSGVFASAQTIDAFASAVQRFQSIAWDRSAIREHARQFHIEKFTERMRDAVHRAQKNFHR
jgi:glycosyltransferase involved in cell wall biosynthesis